MQKHIFDVDVAARYGAPEADMLQWFASVLDNGAACDDCYTQEGECWIKLCTRQLQAEFPYHTPYVLRSALSNLVDYRLLKTDGAAKNVQGRKRKFVSYALTHKGYELTHA